MNWAIVILTSAGSGAIGAAVTAYGTQAKERRAARGDVRACLQRVEQIARYVDTSPGYHAQLVAALDDLQGAMLIAGLPYYLAAFYADVRLLAYATHVTEAPEELYRPRSHRLVSGRVAHQTAVLLVKVIWHPWLSAPTRRWQTRHLQRTLDSGMPDRARFRQSTRGELRKWERSLHQPEPDESGTPQPASISEVNNPPVTS